MIAIFRRELKSYFTGIIGWAYAAIILAFTGLFTMAYNLSTGTPKFESIFNSTILLLAFLFAIALLTMGIFAEERHSRTDQLLYSLPVSMTRIAFAKYAALLIVMLLPAVLMCAYPLVLTRFGHVSLKPALMSILMLYLMSATLGAIGMFVSSVTSSQVSSLFITFVVFIVILVIQSLSTYIPDTAIASQICFGALVVLFALCIFVFTRDLLVTALSFAVPALILAGFILKTPSSFAGLFPDLIARLAIVDRFYTVTTGILDLTAIVYFISLSGVFLFLTVQALEKRRWN